LTRLPEPFLPLHDSDIKRLSKLDGSEPDAVTCVFANAGNRMGMARRCNLARLFLSLRSHQRDLQEFVMVSPEGFQSLTRVSLYHFIDTHLSFPTKTTDLPPYSPLVYHFDTAIRDTRIDSTDFFRNTLILPPDTVKELKDTYHGFFRI
jgi:hypothetical protein